MALCESFFGYHPSVLKSGIQKYARRAEVQKGLWCLVEMDLFSLLEWDGAALEAYLNAHPGATRERVQAQARKIRTNMVNRLVVVMSEEVGICAWWMPIVIHRLYEGWVSNRGNPVSRKYLVDMYLYLTSQRMARLISDIHSVYLVPPSYVKPRQMEDLAGYPPADPGAFPECIRPTGGDGQAPVVGRLAGVPAKHSRVLRGHHLQPGDRVRSRLLLGPAAIRSRTPAGPIRADGLGPAAALHRSEPRLRTRTARHRSTAGILQPDDAC